VYETAPHCSPFIFHPLVTLPSFTIHPSTIPLGVLSRHGTASLPPSPQHPMSSYMREDREKTNRLPGLSLSQSSSNSTLASKKPVVSLAKGETTHRKPTALTQCEKGAGIDFSRPEAKVQAHRVRVASHRMIRIASHRIASHQAHSASFTQIDAAVVVPRR
jgi:hypothetical protein